MLPIPIMLLLVLILAGAVIDTGVYILCNSTVITWLTCLSGSRYSAGVCIRLAKKEKKQYRLCFEDAAQEQEGIMYGSGLLDGPC